MEKLKIGNMNVSFLSATRYHINGGILLMVIVLLAMIIANSPWGDAYAAFWNKEVHLQIGEFNLFSHNGNHMTLMNFINDALMTIFFFVWDWKLSVKHWWVSCPVFDRLCCR